MAGKHDQNLLRLVMQYLCELGQRIVHGLLCICTQVDMDDLHACCQSSRDTHIAP
jgi:hypothetical protein